MSNFEVVDFRVWNQCRLNNILFFENKHIFSLLEVFIIYVEKDNFNLKNVNNMF